MSAAELRRANVNLSELATTVGDEIRRTLPADRTIEFVVQPGLGARGDARLLRVVLNNLVANAAKFTRSSAKARIEVGSRGPDTDPAFFVADNGGRTRHALCGRAVRCVRAAPRRPVL